MSDQVGLLKVPGNNDQINLDANDQVNEANQLKNSELGQKIGKSTNLDNLERESVSLVKENPQPKAASSGSKGLSVAFKVLSAVCFVAGIAAGAAAIVATCGVAGIVGAAAATVTGLLGTTGTAIAAGAGTLVGAGALAAGKGLEPKHIEEFINEERDSRVMDEDMDDTDDLFSQFRTEDKNHTTGIADERDENINPIEAANKTLIELYGLDEKYGNEVLKINDIDKNDGYSEYAVIGRGKADNQKKVINALTHGNFKFPEEINSEGFKNILTTSSKLNNGNLSEADRKTLSNEFDDNIVSFVKDILTSANVTTEDDPAVLAALVQMGISSYFDRHDPINEDEAVGGLMGDFVLSDHGREYFSNYLDAKIGMFNDIIREDSQKLSTLQSKDNASEEDNRTINELQRSIDSTKSKVQCLGIYKDALDKKVGELLLVHSEYQKKHPAA